MTYVWFFTIIIIPPMPTQLWKRSGAWLNNAMPSVSFSDDELLKVQEQQEVQYVTGCTATCNAGTIIIPCIDGFVCVLGRYLAEF